MRVVINLLFVLRWQFVRLAQVSNRANWICVINTDHNDKSDRHLCQFVNLEPLLCDESFLPLSEPWGLFLLCHFTLGTNPIKQFFFRLFTWNLTYLLVKCWLNFLENAVDHGHPLFLIETKSISPDKIDSEIAELYRFILIANSAKSVASQVAHSSKRP